LDPKVLEMDHELPIPREHDESAVADEFESGEAVERRDLFVKKSDQPMRWTLLHVGMMWRKYLETTKVDFGLPDYSRFKVMSQSAVHGLDSSPRDIWLLYHTFDTLPAARRVPPFPPTSTSGESTQSLDEDEGRALATSLSAPIPVLELMIGLVLQAEGGLAEAGLLPTLDDELEDRTSKDGNTGNSGGTSPPAGTTAVGSIAMGNSEMAFGGQFGSTGGSGSSQAARVAASKHASEKKRRENTWGATITRKLQFLFTIGDLDGTGTISRAELVVLLRLCLRAFLRLQVLPIVQFVMARYAAMIKNHETWVQQQREKDREERHRVVQEVQALDRQLLEEALERGAEEGDVGEAGQEKRQQLQAQHEEQEVTRRRASVAYAHTHHHTPNIAKWNWRQLRLGEMADDGIEPAAASLVTAVLGNTYTPIGGGSGGSSSSSSSSSSTGFADLGNAYTGSANLGAAGGGAAGGGAAGSAGASEGVGFGLEEVLLLAGEGGAVQAIADDCFRFVDIMYWQPAQKERGQQQAKGASGGDEVEEGAITSGQFVHWVLTRYHSWAADERARVEREKRARQRDAGARFWVKLEAAADAQAAAEEASAGGASRLEHLRGLWKGLRVSFQSWDSDGNGQVDADEFHYGCGLHQIPISLEEAHELFEAFDDDGNGTLDLYEFDSIIKSAQQEAEAEGKGAVVGTGMRAAEHLGGRGGNLGSPSSGSPPSQPTEGAADRSRFGGAAAATAAGSPIDVLVVFMKGVGLPIPRAEVAELQQLQQEYRCAGGRSV
jgi:Ca2+-binding EF-hand superfamily protein